MTTTSSRATTTSIEVRCASPTCGTSGHGKLMFRLSPNRRTIFIRCERGHENVVELDSLDTARYTPVIT